MKVLAVTGTRADWGLLEPVFDILRKDINFELHIAATGQHLMTNNTSLAAISDEGYCADCLIDMKLSADDSPAALARGIGAATAGMGKVLETVQPDLVMLLGDRYEALAVAQAAVIARVPIAHLCGGDVTEGAFDDSIRHAITKLSALHFPTNVQSASRIVQMGENPLRVHNVGSTGIDRILGVEPMAYCEFFDCVGLLPQAHNFIVTFHPVTLSDDSVDQARAMLDALDTLPKAGLIFTGSNADPSGRDIDTLVRSYVAQRHNAVFHSSLGSRLYFSALTHCDLVIGNSSSGLMEAPSFRTPTVNIGDRQARRPRADSIIDCDAKASAIAAAIHKGIVMDCSEVLNPYGDGRAAYRIHAVLAELNDIKTLVRKSFLDLTK